MPQSSKKPNSTEHNSPVEFSAPLMMSPGEDIRGFLTFHGVKFLLFLITCASVLAVLLIFFFVCREAIPFLTQHDVAEFFTSTDWYPEADTPQFGGLALITGSIYATLIAMVIAVPIGLLAAIFLSDIAPFKLREYIKPIIELLAAIPSVAYGFFAILIFAPMLQKQFGFTTGANALNAGIILGIMALPTIISVAEDSLSAVGREIREASYGLGANRFETIIKVVMPAAHSGIIAGIILGVMRAIGETMVVLMASGNASQIPTPWYDIGQSIRTMTATIAGEMGETAKGSDHYYSLFAIGLILLVFTLLLNLISEHFMARIRNRAGGNK
ncbi:Phosphate transport system permease protein PstC [Anaerohalosphaera lusitana]|uniref:Phosphate transport system permease protein n=1 Tax=Anaerohalosphaera lusitana TaxID=1936003 RepID=A0A1U9NP60_9BACT|nr:phosphate ABC transporter permease subunit PstC [Anaerohalosphaera lusitana]AQT69524.1 Phosphate transport system permease protein PstC [Anaerohalosphaera lusitana]